MKALIRRHTAIQKHPRAPAGDPGRPPPAKDPKPRKGPLGDPTPDQPTRRDPPPKGPGGERKRIDDPPPAGQPSEIKV